MDGVVDLALEAVDGRLRIHLGVEMEGKSERWWDDDRGDGVWKVRGGERSE